MVVSDLLGRVLVKKTADDNWANIIINTSEFSQGIYSISLQLPDKAAFIGKLIVVK